MTFVSFPSVFVNQFGLDIYFLSVFHCFFAQLLIMCVYDYKRIIVYAKNRYIIAFFRIFCMGCIRLYTITKFTIVYTKNRYIIAFFRGVYTSIRYFYPFRYFLLFLIYLYKNLKKFLGITFLIVYSYTIALKPA